jgi:serine/threonine protein kinase
MGEVYRARDEHLGRDVAIKVLSAAVAGDPDRLARFEREARVLAHLSHPNILTIHDFGREGETTFVVMELLDGETVRAVIEGGAVDWRKAAEIAASIADGLAASHDHRACGVDESARSATAANSIGHSSVRCASPCEVRMSTDSPPYPSDQIESRPARF